ncbi:hypothetical protein THAOC_03722, partial [Thalassiosira oceanica]
GMSQLGRASTMTSQSSILLSFSSNCLDAWLAARW